MSGIKKLKKEKKKTILLLKQRNRPKFYGKKSGTKHNISSAFYTTVLLIHTWHMRQTWQS